MIRPERRQSAIHRASVSTPRMPEAKIDTSEVRMLRVREATIWPISDGVTVKKRLNDSPYADHANFLRSCRMILNGIQPRGMKSNPFLSEFSSILGIWQLAFSLSKSKKSLLF